MFEQAYRNIEVVLRKGADSLEQDRGDDIKTSYDAKPGVETLGGVNEFRDHSLWSLAAPFDTIPRHRAWVSWPLLETTHATTRSY